jgi:F-type H+-transporting ATPase subunit delta
MAKVNEKEVAVARVYSKALFDVASGRGTTAEVLEELAGLGKLATEDRHFADFLSSPMIDAKDRRAAIDKMFRGRLSDVVVDGLQVVNRKGRLSLLPAIAEQFRQLLRDRDQRVDVLVSTAVPLSEALRAEITAVVGRFTGRRPDLHEKVDPNLIGGLVLEFGDRKVDGSVLFEISKYRQRFADRAAREIFRGREAGAAEAV